MKKLPIILACLCIVLLAAGLAKLIQEGLGFFRAASENGAEEDVESTAVRTEADITYQNSYLDFSYTIPKDWWLYDLNENNFSPDPARTENPEILDLSYGTDAGLDFSFINLVSFANLKDSRLDNHIGIDISAETLSGIDTIEKYMEYFEAYMLEPDEDTYELLGSGQAVINGQRYEKRDFEVIRESDNFMYATYTRPVRDNYYLTIKASYWPENKNAGAFIEKSLSTAMP